MEIYLDVINLDTTWPMLETTQSLYDETLRVCLGEPQSFFCKEKKEFALIISIETQETEGHTKVSRQYFETWCIKLELIGVDKFEFTFDLSAFIGKDDHICENVPIEIF